MSLLPEAYALSLPRMSLVASAPVPLMPTLTPPEKEAASEAAVEVASMVAFSMLVSEMPPLVVVTPVVALAMYASTSLSIWFSATEMPMATETAVPPASEAASEAAAALAVMLEVSVAPKLTLAAWTPAPGPLPSPSWYACTSVEMTFPV